MSAITGTRVRVVIQSALAAVRLVSAFLQGMLGEAWSRLDRSVDIFLFLCQCRWSCSGHSRAVLGALPVSR